MDFCLEDEIPMSAGELWQTMHTPAFDAFMAGEYGLKSYLELERRISGNLMYRRMRVITTIDLSCFARSIANKMLGGDRLVYEEVQEKRLDRFQMHFWIEPPVLKDRVKISGELRLTPIDDNRCLRRKEGRIDVGLFGVGGIVKRLAAEQQEKSKDLLPRVVAKWKSRNLQPPASRIQHHEGAI